MSIIFIGTPDFAVPSLKALAEAGTDIDSVITQPDRPAGRGRHPRPPPVKLAAQELGLEVLQLPTLRDPDVIANIAARRPEAMVAVAYGQILRKDLLAIPPRGILNVHPSLLPRWRGASPIPAAILAGDAETGVTIILMDQGMDSGPIISQTSVRIAPSDTTASLMDTLAPIAADLLVKALRAWLAGNIDPLPQDESRITTCPILRKGDGQIDWSLPAEQIWRRVRAYNPWPGAFTGMDGDMLNIWKACALGEEPGIPGRVTALDPKARAGLEANSQAAAFAVETAAGLLVPLEVQRSGRRRISAAELLRGMPQLIGRRLGNSPPTA